MYTLEELTAIKERLQKKYKEITWDEAICTDKDAEIIEHGILLGDTDIMSHTAALYGRLQVWSRQDSCNVLVSLVLGQKIADCQVLIDRLK